MAVIENFAELSAEELKKFAEALVKTINSENIFTAETNFNVISVDVDELSGGLTIVLDHDDLIEVQRAVDWTCSNEDDIYNDPGHDADYLNSIYAEAKKSFKTLSTTIEGYDITLSIDDVDEEETVEVTVDSTTQVDDGIGDYEYFGFKGHDSYSYIKVEGTISKACNCALSLFVEPADVMSADPIIEY